MRKEAITIYARKESDSTINLYLGDPDGEKIVPSLGEYLSEYRGLDLDSREAVWEYLRNYCDGQEGLEDMDSIDKEKTDPLPFLGNLDEPLSIWSSDYDDWMDWYYDCIESPAAQFYLFIEPLQHEIKELHCIEGDRPGSNLTYCYVSNEKDLATLISILEEKGYAVDLRWA
jgi:hypothetical protein